MAVDVLHPVSSAPQTAPQTASRPVVSPPDDSHEGGRHEMKLRTLQHEHNGSASLVAKLRVAISALIVATIVMMCLTMWSDVMFIPAAVAFAFTVPVFVWHLVVQQKQHRR